MEENWETGEIKNIPNAFGLGLVSYYFSILLRNIALNWRIDGLSFDFTFKNFINSNITAISRLLLFDHIIDSSTHRKRIMIDSLY